MLFCKLTFTQSVYTSLLTGFKLLNIIRFSPCKLLKLLNIIRFSPCTLLKLLNIIRFSPCTVYTSLLTGFKLLSKIGLNLLRPNSKLLCGESWDPVDIFCAYLVPST